MRRFQAKPLLLTMLLALFSSGVIAQQNQDLTSLDLDCVINPSKQSDLGVRVPGVLDKINVDRSDVVQKGQLVASLNSEVEQAALALAQERYNSINTEIRMRYASIALAERQYQRSLDAFNGDALSKHDLDVSETELQLAKIQLLQAKAKQKIEAKELERAKRLLTRKSVYAPFSGVVVERFKTEGEYVNDEPVLRLANLNPLFIEVILSAEYLQHVKPGMHANVWNKQAQDKSWSATVVRVDKIIDAASSTFGVRLQLDNHQFEIPAGQQCQLKFVSSNDAASQTAEQNKEKNKEQHNQQHNQQSDISAKTLQAQQSAAFEGSVKSM